MTGQQKLKQAVEDCNAQQRAQKPGAVVVCMSDVQPESIEWLWPDYIPQGKITVFVGDPGVGKSMLTAALASNVSTGRPWPVGKAACPQGDVIMLCGEDDLGDTVRPRLDAAGADVSRVHAITMIKDVIEDGSIEERLFSLGRDIGHLEVELENLPDARTVIIDPVTNTKTLRNYFLRDCKPDCCINLCQLRPQRDRDDSSCECNNSRFPLLVDVEA